MLRILWQNWMSAWLLQNRIRLKSDFPVLQSMVTYHSLRRARPSILRQSRRVQQQEKSILIEEFPYYQHLMQFGTNFSNSQSLL